MSHQRPRRRLGFLRALLLGVAVFVVSAFTGALLAGADDRPGEPSAATEVTALSDQRPALSDQRPALSDQRSADARRAAEERHDLGRSLISSGAAGLVVAVTGLVVVARRWRLW